MNADSFIDTNVLTCAAAGHRDAPERHACAWDIIGDGDYGISAQALAEFHANAIGKPAVPPTRAEAAPWAAGLQAVPVSPAGGSPAAEAVNRSRSRQISYRGAAIIIAAERLGTPTLDSEDLNDGQRRGTATVVNPFRASQEG
jgi:predicted nucleic acid-binding protein